jgi:hypothetical protein
MLCTQSSDCVDWGFYKHRGLILCPKPHCGQGYDAKRYALRGFLRGAVKKGASYKIYVSGMVDSQLWWVVLNIYERLQ